LISWDSIGSIYQWILENSQSPPAQNGPLPPWNQGPSGPIPILWDDCV